MSINNVLDTKAAIPSIKNKTKSSIIGKEPHKCITKQKQKPTQKEEETTHKHFLSEQKIKGNSDKDNRHKPATTIATIPKSSIKRTKMLIMHNTPNAKTTLSANIKFATLSSYKENKQKESEDIANDEPCKYDRINNDNFYITTKGGMTSYPHPTPSNSNQQKETVLRAPH